MLTKEYRQACRCKNATASGPRAFVTGPIPEGDGWRAIAGWSHGPVCDNCNIPWEEVYFDPTDERDDLGHGTGCSDEVDHDGHRGPSAKR